MKPYWLPDAGGAGQDRWIYFLTRGKGASRLYARDRKTKNYW